MLFVLVDANFTAILHIFLQYQKLLQLFTTPVVDVLNFRAIKILKNNF